jgi:hypothetical protein
MHLHIQSLTIGEDGLAGKASDGAENRRKWRKKRMTMKRRRGNIRQSSANEAMRLGRRPWQSRG